MTTRAVIVPELVVVREGIRHIVKARVERLSEASGERAVQPSDADVPLPPLPTDYEPTDADLQLAVNAWNANMEKWDGLLEAEIEEEDD